MKRPVTLATIERFLQVTGWGPSRFSRAVGSNPSFVSRLRQGRATIDDSRERAVSEFIEGYVREARETAKKLGGLLR